MRSLFLPQRQLAAAEELLAAILSSPTTPAYIQLIGGKTFRSNPLQLPASSADGAMNVIVGFLGETATCDAQIELLRNLAPAKKVESLSQTAAQAGRLRLWMTTEPALAPETPGVGFRIHARSSDAAAIVSAIESAVENSEAYVISEAGSGVIRGTLVGPTAPAPIIRIASQAKARLLWTQGPPNAASREALATRIKQSLDPKALFAYAPADAAS